MGGTKAPLDGLSETFMWDTNPNLPKNQHFAWHRPMFLAAAGPVMPKNRVSLPPNDCPGIGNSPQGPNRVTEQLSWDLETHYSQCLLIFRGLTH